MEANFRGRKAIHAQTKIHGNGWFKDQGGRKGLAKKYGIKVEVLNHYFFENGDLRSLGNDIVDGPSKEQITNNKLLQCMHLHSTGAWPEEGIQAVAETLNVKHGTLSNYFMADGTRRHGRGEKRLESIEKWISVAQRESYSTEGSYKPDMLPNSGHRPSGLATPETSTIEAQERSAPQGASRVIDDTSMPPPDKIAWWRRTSAAVKAIHAKMEAHGKTWFTDQGGLKVLARKYDVSRQNLATYFLENGDMRAPADDIINGASKKPVTDEILLQCDHLRSTGAWPKGGLPAVAKMFNVSYIVLKNYFSHNGTPTTPRGKNRLESIKKKISVGLRRVQ
ncbi:hypothetical protein PI93_021010 [Pandoraea fibrosis]|uniref:Uncharacterized protein n=1 Tax=Pandoraea fibrosis TaxID=1891094 RepID=A0ABX6HVC7_9BURK|nr:hypothetical protein [Pandoraea fibrosis]QHE91586.1 hypothetical protein PJ20_006990 [Pandoraea fibrosis]QHF14856.1 hypothetical protein PI93_021010 [Pandoraea fibrosis]